MFGIVCGLQSAICVEPGGYKLQFVGYCFNMHMAETTQTFTVANITPKKKVMFKPKASIFVKVWAVSVLVKQ